MSSARCICPVQSRPLAAVLTAWVLSASLYTSVAPGQVVGGVMVGAQHPLVGGGGVGPREFDARSQRLKDRYSGSGGGNCLATAAHVPPDAGQPPQRTPLPQPVA